MLPGPGGGTLPAPKMRALRQRLVARGRKLQSLLLDQQQADHVDIEPEWQPPETLLARVTQCLVQDPETWELAWMQGTSGLDASLQIHSCVSRRRELEVAKARIQEALLADPTLRLSDICIHAPRIEPYRSFIGLVFAPEPGAVPLALDDPGAAGSDGPPCF
jgi:exonuclease V gamma subunit